MASRLFKITMNRTILFFFYFGMFVMQMVWLILRMTSDMTSLCKLGKTKVNKDTIFVKANESSFELAEQVVRRIIWEIRQLSPNLKIAIGTSSGWIIGLLVMKIGRTLALATGGGLILMQIACDQGYVSVNWNQVNENFRNGRDKPRRSFKDHLIQPDSIRSWRKTLVDFAVENMSLAMGLLGGFLIGLATC